MSDRDDDRPAHAPPHDDLDPAVVAKLVDEITATGPMQGSISSFGLFQLVGIVQLALRHPRLSADVRRAGVTFVEHARAHFAGCPTVLDVIRRGDDPTEDRPHG